MLTPDAIQRIRDEAYAEAWTYFRNCSRTDLRETLSEAIRQRCIAAADEAERKARENAGSAGR